jgi:hypothetical protein
MSRQPKARQVPPRSLVLRNLCVLGLQRQCDEHRTFRLDWLQAKSKSRQENYFSLLAKSKSGPARDISVDFGSSTGLMSRQVRGRTRTMYCRGVQ